MWQIVELAHKQLWTLLRFFWKETPMTIKLVDKLETNGIETK